jgi:hypothetical protein
LSPGDSLSDSTWNRWYAAYGDFASRMIREAVLRLALKYKREHITALQPKRFMTSILGRIDQERRKLEAEVAERPGYNELGDPRAVETEREGTQWTR